MASSLEGDDLVFYSSRYQPKSHDKKGSLNQAKSNGTHPRNAQLKGQVRSRDTFAGQDRVEQNMRCSGSEKQDKGQDSKYNLPNDSPSPSSRTVTSVERACSEEKKGNNGRGRGSRRITGKPFELCRDEYTESELHGELTGKVINILSGYGFITPDKNLPQPFGTPVFFHFSHVQGAPLKKHDRVAFKVDPSQTKKPKVSYVMYKEVGCNKAEAARSSETKFHNQDSEQAPKQSTFKSKKAREMETASKELYRMLESPVQEDTTIDKVENKMEMDRYQEMVKNYLGEETEVEALHKVTNDKFKVLWLKAHLEMQDRSCRRSLFFSTDYETADDILNSGFAALQSANKRKKLSNTKAQKHERVLLYCDLLLGRSYNATDKILSPEEMEKENYDSIFIKNKQDLTFPDDLIIIAKHGIYNPDQILATHLVYIRTPYSNNEYTEEEIDGVLYGTIKTINKGYGFITPEKKLPQPYSQKKDVYFLLKDLGTDEDIIGQNIVFLLQKGFHNKPCVITLELMPKALTDKPRLHVNCGHLGFYDQCQKKCSKLLQCGHECRKKCSDECPKRCDECLHLKSQLKAASTKPKFPSNDNKHALRADLEMEAIRNPSNKIQRPTLRVDPSRTKKTKVPYGMNEDVGGSKAEISRPFETKFYPQDSQPAPKQSTFKKSKKDREREQQLETLCKELYGMLESSLQEDTYIDKVESKIEMDRFGEMVKNYLGEETEVEALHKVTNDMFKVLWLKAHLEMQDPSSHRSLFFSTDYETADDILNSGFASLQSANKRKKLSNTKAQKHERVLLYCDLLLGRSYNATDKILSPEEMEEENYNSIFIKNKQDLTFPDDLIIIAKHGIYNPDQILATHLLYISTPHSKNEYTEEEIDGVLYGTIKTINKGYGFITPEKKLPQPYSQKKDVYFLLKDLGTDEDIIGQNVVFLLQKGFHNKPCVITLELMPKALTDKPRLHANCGHLGFYDQCQKKCSKLLQCGHECRKKCSDECPKRCKECVELKARLQATSSVPQCPSNDNKHALPDDLEMQAIRNPSNEMKKYTLRAKREFSGSNTLDMNYRIAESQFLRFAQKSSVSYEIQSVDYYVNPVLVRRFHEKKQALRAKYGQCDRSEHVLAFHGTESANVGSIVRHNFSLSLSQRGLYGRGIYLSEFPNVSLTYGGSLLLCKVLPGHSYDVAHTMNNADLQYGYDSHRVQADHQGYGWALVLFDAKQILPCYVINYKKVGYKADSPSVSSHIPRQVHPQNTSPTYPSRPPPQTSKPKSESTCSVM